MHLVKTKPVVWTAAAVIVVALGALAWLWAPESRLAPAVSLTTLDGERLTLASLRGRPVLVNFWATSCRTCVRDMPELMRLHRELGPRGLTIIAVAMPYDPPSRVLTMAQERRIPYPIALDVQGEVLRAFGDVPGTPTTYLINSEGRIIERHTGPLDFEILRARIMAMFEIAA